MATLADLLGLSATSATPLSSDQLAALPPVALPPAALQMYAANNPGVAPGAPTSATGAAPTAAPAQHHSFGSGLRDFLGGIADALSQATGGQPMYEQSQEKSALSDYLGDPAGSMQKLMQVNPQLGISLMSAQAKARYDYERELPPELRDLHAMGVDPSSPQGQQILQSKLGKTPNAVITEYQYYRQNGGQLGFGDFVRLIHPPMGGSLEETGGSGDRASPPAPSQPALRYDPQNGWVPE